MNIIRKVCIFFDKGLLGLLDNAYTIIFDIAGVNIDASAFDDITKKLYIIIGIFSLFRIAVFLINALIDPEKLTESGKGISNIFARFLIMLVILVITPFLFSELYTIQNTIVTENVIPRIILNKDIYGNVAGGNATVSDIGESAGKQMQSVIFGALVTINEDAFDNQSDETQVYYVPKQNVTCNSECINALNNYSVNLAKGSLTASEVKDNINTLATIDDGNGGKEKVYVYNYIPLVTGLAGGFITYMMFSFAIDLAVRIFELIVLQVLSPIFIVTFVDPKSSSSGPFSKWLKAVGQSYVSLFLRLGLICLMVLLTSWLNTSDTFLKLFATSSGFLTKLIIMAGLLIFVKKLPSWIAAMFGIEDSGFGGLGIGKKLAGAAVMGTAIEKGISAAKSGIKSGISNATKTAANHTKTRLKNKGDRDLTRLAARRQAGKSYFKGQTDRNGNPVTKKQFKKEAGQAAFDDEKLKQLQNPDNDFRLFKNARDKAAEARKGVDENYQSRKDKKIEEVTGKLEASLKAAGLDDKLARDKIASDIARGRAIYGKKLRRNKNGTVNTDATPITNDQLNDICKKYFGHKANSVEEAAIATYVARAAEDGIIPKGHESSAAKGLANNGEFSITDSSGKTITLNAKDIVSSMNYNENLLAQSTVLTKSIETQENYNKLKERKSEVATEIADLQKKLKEVGENSDAATQIEADISKKNEDLNKLTGEIKKESAAIDTAIAGASDDQKKALGYVEIDGDWYGKTGKIVGNTVVDFNEAEKEKYLSIVEEKISKAQSKIDEALNAAISGSSDDKS